MSGLGFNTPLSRRRALELALGGTVAGSLIAAGSPLADAKAAAPAGAALMPDTDQGDRDYPLPVAAIEKIVRAKGMVMDSVLSIDIDRTDLHVTGPHGIPFKPSWEVRHEFAFQGISSDTAILNGEMALLPSEANPVIHQIVTHDLNFMAFHQHFFDLNPMVFFIHMSGIGHPLDLARGVAAMLSVTATPLPQKPPEHPTTPLDADALGDILGGMAMVRSDGVVGVDIPRKETIYLHGVRLESETNVFAHIDFEPLGSTGNAAVAPDLPYISPEINPTTRMLQDAGFTIHCLYNQETAEQPQLYWQHSLRTGNAITLARQIRRAINDMNLAFMS